MKPITAIFKSPLLHFLVLGLLLFVAFAWLNPESTERNERITISKGQIKNMSERYVKKWKRTPTAQELKSIIDDYVMTEMYYREGLKLGLDKNDPIIKKRIRQKTEMIVKDVISLLDIDDKTLQKYLDTHSDKFTTDAVYTFDQIYINPAKHSLGLNTYLLEVKKQLDETGSATTDSLMLPGQYKDSTSSRINRELGKNFSKALDSIKLDEWSEPLQGALGVHFVKLIKRSPVKLPNLEEVRDEVLREYLSEKRKEILAVQRKQMSRNYEIVIDLNSSTSQKADVK